MNKKMLVIAATAGLVSFGGMFGVAWMSRSVEVVEVAEEAVVTLPVDDVDVMAAFVDSPAPLSRKTVAEARLKNLIEDVRGKADEYQRKLDELGAREDRIKLTQELVNKDVEELKKLRIELAAKVTQIRQEQESLEANLVRISKIENDNLAALAATYDKMDAASASKILANMIQMQGSSITTWDDAVKIVYFMGDRSKAKLLSEMVSSEPTLAAVLCQKLKLVTEDNK